MVTIQVHCALGYMIELYLSEDDRLSLTAPVESSIPLPQLEDVIHIQDQFFSNLFRKYQVTLRIHNHCTGQTLQRNLLLQCVCVNTLEIIIDSE